MKNRIKLGITTLLLTSSLSIQAAPIQWTTGAGANNNWYEFVEAPATWQTARTNALASTFNGMSGYLATIASLEENDFILGLSSQGWIGATDQIVEGDWVWADGPEAGLLFWQGGAGGTTIGGNFSNWGAGEPNNQGNEDYAFFISTGQWNDGGSSPASYFVEYSSSVSNVPAPAAVWLLGSGLIGLIGSRKKSAKLASNYT